jgi:CheY-like chemotaxis protein
MTDNALLQKLKTSEIPMSDTSPARHARPRVLLLDDDPFTLAMLGDLLDEIGQFEVFSEPDARRALRTLSVSMPDLVICDLALPDMDGIEFMQAAAQAGFSGGVVLLSGLDGGLRAAAATLAQAHGLRVLGSFGKPLTLAALRAIAGPLAAAAGCGDPSGPAARG